MCVCRKRLLKAEHREAKWEAKKKLKKEKKKEEQEKRQAEREQQKALRGDQDDTDADKEAFDFAKAAAERKARKQEEKLQFIKNCDDNFKVIIDCAFEDEHSENGLRSLTQQIMYAYGVNKRSTKPCHTYITGLGDTTWAQLSKTHPENWQATTIHREPYQEVVTDKKLVYLTADSPNTITSLDTSCAYIIGGIVDRNRLKGITYEKAVAENIETAKLPLDECIKMMGNSKTKVLTVNHVFEILLKFAESSSWVNAFQTTLPERKDVVVISNEEKKAKEDAIKKTDDSTTTVMKESAMEENSADVADVADGKD
jgi:tRNA (guanine9-N1)-methyltransferase